MKFIILQYFLIMLTTGSLLAQTDQLRALALSEALEIAMQKSYSTRMAENRVLEMKGKSLESWGGFLPTVTISENYINSNDPVTVFGLKLRQGIFTQNDFTLTALNKPDAIDNFATALQIQQPILNLDAIYGKRAARSAVSASQAAAQRTDQAATFTVKRAYFGLIVARSKIGAIAEAIESAKAHIGDAEMAVEQGMINRADLLAAEVRLSELLEQHISAEHEMLNASDILKLALGLEGDETIIPTDTLTTKKITPTETEEFSRTDLQALNLQKDAARRALSMHRSKWFPRLNGFAVFEWNADEAFAKDGSNWMAGLQLQWQLFDGLGQFGRSKQAGAKWRQAEIAVQEAEAKAATELRKAKRAVTAAEQRIKVANRALSLAIESLRITEARFQQGLTKTSDLLDREVATTNAKLRLLAAKHDLAIAISELEFVR